MTTFTTQDRQDAQRTPLTDEEIHQIMIQIGDQYGTTFFGKGIINQFARAIERAHGIGE